MATPPLLPQASFDQTLWENLIHWGIHGLSDLSWWQVLLCTLLLTHITIISVTLYLHRCQAHRSLELHPALAHFFRFWLWLTTSMVTKEWVAIHRKHHAKCETAEDPHSPQTKGISTVFWRGAELYRAEAYNETTLKRFGHGTPDDGIENRLYSRYPSLGIVLMLFIDLLLFGALGLTVWAVQMAWIPIHAAGIINGIGHYWGYRNFNAPDASTNILPWGIIIGGEELHNNHHTYPTSAKFKVKPYELDIGWVYICILSQFKLAKAKKTPPRLHLGPIRPVADGETLEALISNRYEIMAQYAKAIQVTVRLELSKLHTNQKFAEWQLLKAVKKWLALDQHQIPNAAQAQVQQVEKSHPALATMLSMRQELQSMWLNTHHSREQIVKDLCHWCEKAESSGIAALCEFSTRLRAAQIGATSRT